MKIRAVRAIPAPIEQVRPALVEASRWRAWVPGLVEAAAAPRGQGRYEAELLLQGPRTFRVRLEVTTSEEGLSYGLLEGDASALSGSLRLHATEEGCAAVWELEIVFPLAVPGALMAEIEGAAPRWLGALERAALAP